MEKEDKQIETSEENINDAQLEIERQKQEQYQKKIKAYQNYMQVMRYISFALCALTVLACLIGGICMIALDLGVGAIVAGAIMLLIAPVVGIMLFMTLYLEKHPEKLKAHIMKKAEKIRASEIKKKQKKEKRNKE